MDYVSSDFAFAVQGSAVGTPQQEPRAAVLFSSIWFCRELMETHPRSVAWFSGSTRCSWIPVGRYKLGCTSNRRPIATTSVARLIVNVDLSK